MEKFKHIDTWVFDLDNTLYDASTGVFDRICDQMNLYVSELLKIPLVDASELRKRYWKQYGTTLNGLMQEHKIDPHEFLLHAHEINISDVPQCEIIKAHLPRLPGKKIVFTNSSREFAERMTKHLGIRHHFDHVFTIEDAQFKPKPLHAPYQAVIKNFSFDPKKAAMFDDMEVNLKTAAELGLTTVWVHGDNKNPADHALPHLHHKTTKLADWLVQTVPQHPTRKK